MFIPKCYEWKSSLLELLAQLNNIDGQFLDEIIEILRKQDKSDCIGFLSNDCNQKQIEECFTKQENFLSSKDKQIKIENINFIRDILNNILALEVNQKKNFLINLRETRKLLIKNDKIINFLKFLVRQTAFDQRFIQSGSSLLNLLVEMKVSLRVQNFQNIRIKDVELIGGIFVRCNLSGSKFDNVDISGINLNRAQLFNCKDKSKNT